MSPVEREQARELEPQEFLELRPVGLFSEQLARGAQAEPERALERD